MMDFFKKFLPNFKETSTWRGIVNVLIAAGVLKDPGQGEALLALALAINGVIAVFFRDKLASKGV